MHPYAPPRAPLLRPDPVFELRRAGRRVGVGSVLAVVTAATLLATREATPDSSFLITHAGCAFTALLPVGMLGGPYVAFRGAGSWLSWCRAVAQVALVAVACAVLGVLLGGSVLRRLGHPAPYATLHPADVASWAWLAVGCVCLALALAGLAGLILRGLAQRWIQTWAPDLGEADR